METPGAPGASLVPTLDRWTRFPRRSLRAGTPGGAKRGRNSPHPTATPFSARGRRKREFQTIVFCPSSTGSSRSSEGNGGARSSFGCSGEWLLVSGCTSPASGPSSLFCSMYVGIARVGGRPPDPAFARPTASFTRRSLELVRSTDDLTPVGIPQPRRNAPQETPHAGTKRFDIGFEACRVHRRVDGGPKGTLFKLP